MSLFTESFLNDLQRNWANCPDQDILRQSNIGKSYAQDSLSSDQLFPTSNDYMSKLQQCASSGAALNNLSLTDAHFQDLSSGIILNQKQVTQPISYQQNRNVMNHKLAKVIANSKLGQFSNSNDEKSLTIDNSQTVSEDEDILLQLFRSLNSNQGMTNPFLSNNYEDIAQHLVRKQQEQLVRQQQQQFAAAELLNLLDQESAMAADNQEQNVEHSLFNPSPVFQNNQFGFHDQSNQRGTLFNQELVRNLTKNNYLSDMNTKQSSDKSPIRGAFENNEFCFKDSAFEPKPLNKKTYATLEKPLLLALPSDKDWITPLHCFIRRHCIEVFTADIFDVASPSKGKRRAIQIGQVGIRCPHCHNSKRTSKNIKLKERGSVYYPTNICSIYNATMNLLQRHMNSCKCIPKDLKKRYAELKADDARSGTSKEYWISSAKSLGLIDTPKGIRYSLSNPPGLTSNSIYPLKESDELRDSFLSNTQLKKDNDAANIVHACLVTPEDKGTATSFSFALLSQMVPCVFTEADRLGKRKGLRTGFRGLACRHCYGGYGSGRFFPSSIKTMSDTSKTLNVLHGHMMRCRKCPEEVKTQLQEFRNTHDSERAKLKFGSQKAFFAKIWKRLHGEEPGMNAQTTLQQHEHGGKRMRFAQSA